uniref:Phosphate-starvation-inducible E n=1 Tax=Thermorudis peleae TaxID=1382356 RepID=A0A831X0W9_9BACT
MSRAEIAAYTAVGIGFLLTGIVALAYIIAIVPVTLARDGVPTTIITVINELLLVVIILEILRTIVGYLDARRLTLRPFLVIAAISATRRILVLGAQMALVNSELPPELFQRALWELVINGGLILVVAIALALGSRFEPAAAHDGTVGR